MIALDEEALICDLAETYQIYNYRALPLHLVAVLANGLGPDSRIRQRQYGLKIGLSKFLLAQINDNLIALRWMLSEDGHKDRNRPDFISPKFLIQNEYTGQFSTPDEFEAFRARMTREEGSDG